MNWDLQSGQTTDEEILMLYSITIGPAPFSIAAFPFAAHFAQAVGAQFEFVA